MSLSPPQYRNSGFSLIELLVSSVILILVSILMVSIVNQATRTWTSTQSKIEQFREAREGFEALARQISQSTLNTYLDYQRDVSGNPLLTSTNSYVRQSELRFISGPGLITGVDYASPTITHSIFFQAPIGLVSNQSKYGILKNLMNTWGYFVAFADDSALRPAFVKTPLRSRFRLMEFMQPSDAMTLYNYTNSSASYSGHEWFAESLKGATPPVHVLAENIVALVLFPKLSPEEDATGTGLAPTYAYDSTSYRSDPKLNSRHQLPPIVQVTMVAIDEVSAARMNAKTIQDLRDLLAGLFHNAVNYEADLKRNPTAYPDAAVDPSLEGFLTRNRINYRIFTTNVSIKGAKWSRE